MEVVLLFKDKPGFGSIAVFAIVSFEPERVRANRDLAEKSELLEIQFVENNKSLKRGSTVLKNLLGFGYKGDDVPFPIVPDGVKVQNVTL